jgi:hypothetical protein
MTRTRYPIFALTTLSFGRTLPAFCLWDFLSHGMVTGKLSNEKWCGNELPALVESFTGSSLRPAPDVCSPQPPKEICGQKRTLMNTDHALTNLLEELRHKRPENRWEAAVQLGNMSSQATAALPTLQEALTDRDGLVRQAAQEAITKIQSGYQKPAKPLPSNLEKSTGIPNIYNEIPWYRRSSTMTVFILVGFFLFPPLLWAACVICLTGEVYNNRLRKDGTLSQWSSGNKFAAVVIMVLQGVGIAYRLGAFGN